MSYSPRRASAVSVATNAGLFFIKLLAGLITGSIALITDAIHSAIDLAAAAVVLISVRAAERPADKTHGYGHGKAENLSALVEGGFVLLGAGVMIWQGIDHVVYPTHLHTLGLGLATAVTAVVVVSALVRYLRSTAQATGSPAIAGDALHMTTDILTSTAVLIGLLLVLVTGYERFDAIAALAVAGLVVISGLRLVWQAIEELLDRTLPDTELQALEAAIVAAYGSMITGHHKLRARHSGTTHYVDLHLQFRRGTSLETAHATSHEVVAAITEVLGHTDVLIHLEPEQTVKKDGVQIKQVQRGSRDTRAHG